MTKGHHNAFATPQPNTEYTDADNHDGLSKREYFAAMAMQGYCAGMQSSMEANEMMTKHAAIMDMDTEQYIAHFATKQANALINALNEKS